MDFNGKKNFLKTIMSLALSVIIICSVVPTAFAAETLNRENIPYDELMAEGYSKEEIDAIADMMDEYAEANSDNDDTPEDTNGDTNEDNNGDTNEDNNGDTNEDNNGNNNEDNNAPEQNTGIVAELSVVTRVKGTGHAWIYVENLTDSPLQVGHYTLPANEGVSVGLFSFTCEDGIGIYYNVESYCCNVHGGDGLVSITTELDKDEMNKLSRKLLDYPNHWDPFFNCMYFAFSMWNSVSSKKVIPLVIPALGQLQLRIHGGKSNNLEMYCPRPNQVLRLKGKLGAEKELVPVSAGSIDQQIGG